MPLLLATKRTNAPFLAPSSMLATVIVTVSLCGTVEACAFAVLVFFDVDMMSFLAFALFVFLFIFFCELLAPRKRGGEK